MAHPAHVFVKIANGVLRYPTDPYPYVAVVYKTRCA